MGETYEPANCKTFHLMQGVSNGKERKTHPSCDVDASGDANDGHNSLNCCNPQFLHSLSTHFPLLFFLQNTQQHPPRSRIELQTNGTSFRATMSPLKRQEGDIERENYNNHH
jgi:hypothetical protein